MKSFDDVLCDFEWKHPVWHWIVMRLVFAMCVVASLIFAIVAVVFVIFCIEAIANGSLLWLAWSVLAVFATFATVVIFCLANEILVLM